MLVDEPNGALMSLVPRLRELEFCVFGVPAPMPAIEFAAHFPKLALVAINERANPNDARALMRRMHDLQPGLPVLWLGGPIGDDVSAPLEVILERNVDAESLVAAADRVLCRRYYPEELVQVIARGVENAVGNFGAYVSQKEAFLKASRIRLAELNSVIMFSGPRLSGSLIIGTSQQAARLTYRRISNSAREPEIDALGDMLGEFCNQTLGRISAYFERRNAVFTFGTPVCVAGHRGTLWQESHHPSLGLELEGIGGQVFAEFCVNTPDGATSDGLAPDLLEAGQFVML